PELVDSWIKVEKVILLEQIRGTGNLVKPSCNLLLFPKCKSQPTITRRNSFQYSDIFDDTYPLENQLTPISISSSNWTFEHTVPNIADAMAIVDLTSQAIHFKSDGTQNLFGVLVTTQTTNPFASSVKFKVRLIVSLL
ncbi:MAG: hypothetical protein N2560_02750, partial [Ignavibacteria bacterium]|nr:hypothetical protein [Ignavibacteria bacterium]